MTELSQRTRIVSLCVFLGAMVGAPADAACKVTVKDLDGDGAAEVALENGLIRYVFAPGEGGECIGISSKDGRLEEDAFIYHIFETLDWRHQYGQEQVFTKVPHTYEIEKNAPEEVVLHQYKRGQQEFRYITIHTRMFLRAGCTSLRCDYEVANAHESMGTFQTKLWLHNSMTPTTGTSTCYLSQQNGLPAVTYTFDDGAKTEAGNKTVKLSAPKSPRGWMGVKKGGPGETGPGVAYWMDWRLLHWMYFWFGRSYANVEWRYIPYPLKAGQSLKTEVYVSPFPELPRIDHAAKGLVFDTGTEKVVTDFGRRTMRIAFDRARTLDVRLRVRAVKAPDAPPPELTEVMASSVSSPAWTVAEVPYALEELPKGAYVLKCLVTEDGKELADFERRFDVGEEVEGAPYAYLPVGKKTQFAEAEVQRYSPYEPSMGVQTSHFDWYQPCARGKVSVLYFGHSRASRRIVELAQRLDMEYAAPCVSGVFAYGPVSSAVGAPDIQEYTRRLGGYLKGAAKHDVILIEGLGRPGGTWASQKKASAQCWKKIPASVKKQIARRVEEGAGLIMLEEPLPECGEIFEIYWNLKKGEDDLELGLEETPRPNLLSDREWNRIVQKEQVVWGRHGEGRVLFRTAPWVLLPRAHWSGQGGESHYRALAELVLWAAGRESPINVRSFKLDSRELSQEGWSEAKLSLAYDSPEALDGAVAELSCFAERPLPEFFKLGPDGKPNPRYRPATVNNPKPAWELHSVAKTPVRINKGRHTLSLAAPHLRSGITQLRLRLLREGKVVKTAVLDLEVAPAVAITEMKLGKDILRPGEDAKGRVRIANVGKRRHEGECRIRAFDVHERELFRQDTEFSLEAGGSAEIALAFNTGVPVSVLHTIRADLYEGGKLTGSKAAEYTVPSVANRYDDWIAFTWGNWPNLYRARSLGFDSYYCAFSRRDKDPTHTRRIHHNLLQTGLRLFPCAIGANLGFDWQQGERLVRKVSFSDPAYLDKELKGLSQLASVGARYGAYAYNLADEPSLGAWETRSQFDWSESSLANFRKWLKREYGTVEKLNESWGTGHKSFDEAEPAVESEVKDKANLAPWQDFRAHMNHEVANAYRTFRKALTSADPGVHVGMCGVNDGHPYSGIDWWELAGICDGVNTYTSCAMLRSLTPGGKFNRYQGYRWGYHTMWDNAWRGHFEGHQGYAYWRDTLFIRPDGTWHEPNVRPIREILATFKNGIGKLWMETARQDRDIMFHYSQSSIHTNWMMKYWQKEVSDGLKFYREERWSMEQAVYDASLDLRYIAYGQIERGELRKRKPKLLVLPTSIAVSRREVDEIKQFVRDGGVLLADTCCALRDEHGKPYETPPLDEVFGIKREPGYADTLALMRGRLPGLYGEVALYVEKGLAPSTGKPQTRFFTETQPDGIPLVIVNEYGKGKGVYLRFAGQYEKGRQLKPQLRELYRQVLEEIAGLKGRYRVVGDAGRVPGMTLLHTYGDAEYFGFYADLACRLPADVDRNDATEQHIASGTQQVAMLLPEARHTYDVLDGRYLGCVDCFQFSAVPGRGRLYSALPYRVSGIESEAPTAAKPSQIIPLRARLVKEGTGAAVHVYHLEVRGPDGKELEWYRKNYRAENGTLDAKLQFPLNAKKGTYTLKLREVATGTEAEKAVEIIR